jgi:hypothetical protein
MNSTKPQPRLGIVFAFAEAEDGNPPVTVDDAEPRLKSTDNAQTAIAVCRNLRDILGELHTLLEEYRPTWYTQRHHENARNALQKLNAL